VFGLRSESAIAIELGNRNQPLVVFRSCRDCASFAATTTDVLRQSPPRQRGVELSANGGMGSDLVRDRAQGSLYSARQALGEVPEQRRKARTKAAHSE